MRTFTLPSQQHVLKRLQTVRPHAQYARPLEELRHLYNENRRLFFALAVVGIAEEAEPWYLSMMQLARLIQACTQRGFRVEGLEKGIQLSYFPLREGAEIIVYDVSVQEWLRICSLVRQPGGQRDGQRVRVDPLECAFRSLEPVT